MYDVIEVSFADGRRLLQYKSDNVFGTEFSIKGFDYPWILRSREWQRSDKVLDVGAGYSGLPIHIADNFGCEVWAVDDFGMGSDLDFWKRNKEPEEHIARHPQVKYVVERLGDWERSSLPLNYFDCIYSASVLEHVPPQLAKQVWAHMNRLLKPGGALIHAIDMKLPTYRGVLSLLKAFTLDAFWFVIPRTYLVENVYSTPGRYLSMVSSALGRRIKASKREVGLLPMVLDPAVVLEPLDWAYNRMIKDGMTEVPLIRVTSLLVHLKKKSR